MINVRGEWNQIKEAALGQLSPGETRVFLPSTDPWLLYPWDTHIFTTDIRLSKQRHTDDTYINAEKNTLESSVIQLLTTKDSPMISDFVQSYYQFV